MAKRCVTSPTYKRGSKIFWRRKCIWRNQENISCEIFTKYCLIKRFGVVPIKIMAVIIYSFILNPIEYWLVNSSNILTIRELLVVLRPVTPAKVPAEVVQQIVLLVVVEDLGRNVNNKLSKTKIFHTSNLHYQFRSTAQKTVGWFWPESDCRGRWSDRSPSAFGCIHVWPAASLRGPCNRRLEENKRNLWITVVKEPPTSFAERTTTISLPKISGLLSQSGF